MGGQHGNQNSLYCCYCHKNQIETVNKQLQIAGKSHRNKILWVNVCLCGFLAGNSGAAHSEWKLWEYWLKFKSLEASECDVCTFHFEPFIGCGLKVLAHTAQPGEGVRRDGATGWNVHLYTPSNWKMQFNQNNYERAVAVVVVCVLNACVCVCVWLIHLLWYRRTGDIRFRWNIIAINKCYCFIYGKSIKRQSIKLILIIRHHLVFFRRKWAVARAHTNTYTFQHMHTSIYSCIDTFGTDGDRNDVLSILMKYCAMPMPMPNDETLLLKLNSTLNGTLWTTKLLLISPNPKYTNPKAHTNNIFTVGRTESLYHGFCGIFQYLCAIAIKPSICGG